MKDGVSLFVQKFSSDLFKWSEEQFKTENCEINLWTIIFFSEKKYMNYNYFLPSLRSTSFHSIVYTFQIFDKVSTKKKKKTLFCRVFWTNFSMHSRRLFTYVIVNLWKAIKCAQLDIASLIWYGKQTTKDRKKIALSQEFTPKKKKKNM